MNSFISSSVGSSILYFCTKIFGSNPAVAYFTNVSPFSVQSRIPIGDYHPAASLPLWNSSDTYLVAKHTHGGTCLSSILQ